MMIIGAVIFVIALLCMMTGMLQLRQKGPLINNAWIYANEEQRRTMDKKPHYIQSGIVFMLIGIQFLMLGLFCVTKLYGFMYAEFAVIGAVTVYAIISSIIIDKNKKNTDNNRR